MTSSFINNWHRYYVPYCSGDSWIGNAVTPDDNGSYFAGHLIIEALTDIILADVGSDGDLENVVLSGCSSGGVGVHYNLDWFKDTVTSDKNGKDAIVLGLPYSSFFPEVDQYESTYYTLTEETAEYYYNFFSLNGTYPLTGVDEIFDAEESYYAAFSSEK